MIFGGGHIAVPYGARVAATHSSDGFFASSRPGWSTSGTLGTGANFVVAMEFPGK